GEVNGRSPGEPVQVPYRGLDVGGRRFPGVPVRTPVLDVSAGEPAPCEVGCQRSKQVEPPSRAPVAAVYQDHDGHRRGTSRRRAQLPELLRMTAVTVFLHRPRAARGLRFRPHLSLSRPSSANHASWQLDADRSMADRPARLVLPDWHCLILRWESTFSRRPTSY